MLGLRNVKRLNHRGKCRKAKFDLTLLIQLHQLPIGRNAEYNCEAERQGAARTLRFHPDKIERTAPPPPRRPVRISERKKMPHYERVKPNPLHDGNCFAVICSGLRQSWAISVPCGEQQVTGKGKQD